MQLFCRHCFKKQKIRTFPNKSHIQAECIVCGNWIKFLNTKEKVILLEEMLNAQHNRMNKNAA